MSLVGRFQMAARTRLGWKQRLLRFTEARLDFPWDCSVVAEELAVTSVGHPGRRREQRTTSLSVWRSSGLTVFVTFYPENRGRTSRSPRPPTTVVHKHDPQYGWAIPYGGNEGARRQGETDDQWRTVVLHALLPIAENPPQA